MRISVARIVLLLIFLLFFAINLAHAVIPFLLGHLEYISMWHLLERVFALYLVHLGVISGGIFAEWAPGPKEADKAALVAALILSILWNVFASWILFWMCWLDTAGGTIEIVKDYLAKFPQLSSCLVSGALTYFFVREARSPASAVGVA